MPEEQSDRQIPPPPQEHYEPQLGQVEDVIGNTLTDIANIDQELSQDLSQTEQEGEIPSYVTSQIDQQRKGCLTQAVTALHRVVPNAMRSKVSTVLERYPNVKRVYDEIEQLQKEEKRMSVLQESGIEDTSRADAVIKHLESKVTKLTRGKKEGEYVYTPYTFSERDSPIIKNFLSHENPVAALEELGEFIDFHDYANLKNFSEYFAIISKNPQTFKNIRQLRALGELRKISTENIRLEITEEGEEKHVHDEYARYRVDPLNNLASVENQDFQQLFTENSIENFGLLHDFLKTKFARDLKIQDAQPVIDISSSRDILQIAQNDSYVALYKAFMDKYTFYTASDVVEVGNSARLFLELIENVPELVSLHDTGFDVTNRLDYASAKLEKSTSIQEKWQERRKEFRKVLSDEQLCANAALMKEYGFTVDINPHADSDTDFYRSADTHRLENTLILWESLSEPFSLAGKVPSHLAFKPLKQIWDDASGAFSYLGDVNPEDLRVALAPIKEQVQESTLPLSLANIASGCKTLDEFRDKLLFLGKPEVQAASTDRGFMQIISQTKGEATALMEALEDEVTFLSLYDNKEKLHTAEQLLQGHTAKRGFKLSNEEYLQLAKLPEQDLQKAGLLFDDFKVFYIEPHHVPYFSSVMQLDTEDITDVAVALYENKLPLLFNKVWDERAVELFAQGPERIMELMGINNMLLQKTGLRSVDLANGNESNYLVFLDYLSKHQEDLDRLEQFVKNGGIESSLADMHSLGRFMNIRDLVVENMDEKEFEVKNFITDSGSATPAFVEIMFEQRNINGLPDILTNDVINQMVNEDDKEFWKFYLRFAHNYHISSFVIEHRNVIDQFMNNGSYNINFIHGLITAGTIDSAKACLEEIGFIDTLPLEEQEFWRTWKFETVREKRDFLYERKSSFHMYFQDGKVTSEYYRDFLAAFPDYSIFEYKREQWRMALGDEAYDRFMSVLPKATDERRNAFTHNEYDRTTEFVTYMHRNTAGDFTLRREDFQTLSAYIADFGFSKTPVLYHYYKHLLAHESSNDNQLPDDIQESGITSITELKERLHKIKALAYSEEEITDLSQFSSFELQMLKLITGKSTHTFDNNRPPFESIVEDFQSDSEAGYISPVPPEYKPETVTMSQIEINFDKEKIAGDYQLLRREILESIESVDDIAPLSATLRELFSQKLQTLRQAMETADDKRRAYMEREVDKYDGYVSGLVKANDLDALMTFMLDVNADKGDKKTIDSVMRGIIFRKVFQHNYSPAMLENIRSGLQDEVSAKGLLTVVNVIDHMAKAHVLNFTNDNEEKYWDNGTFQKLRAHKKGKKLVEVFDPYRNNLHETVEAFNTIEHGAKRDIKMIPDRGFIGEMSGYLANVCYTAEYPLLKPRPNLIPYKFVEQGASPDDINFMGSVLVFEVTDDEGNPSMLVRGFDVPEEGNIDIATFIETFLDKLAVVGQQRGMKRILVPGNSGAMSNYQMTINHIIQNYREGKPSVSLGNNFDFNNYNLTNNCFEARKILPEDSVQ